MQQQQITCRCLFLSFTVAVSLPPSFSSCRIKLHLLQVFHHGGKCCDISENNAEEWVTHLFRLSWPLSTAVPPYPPTSSFLYPFYSSPPLPLTTSLFPCALFAPSSSSSYIFSLFFSSLSVISPMIHPSLSPSFPFLFVSLHLLTALFQVGHCLLCECLKSIPPTLRSSVSQLPSNLSFHWQLHNVLRSHSAKGWMKKDRRTLNQSHAMYSV